MIIKNTTMQNRSKHAKLTSEHTIPTQNVKRLAVSVFLQSLQNIPASKEQIIYSIGCFLLRDNSNSAVKDFLGEYDYEVLSIPGIPLHEFDLLGSAYQFLNTKMENLEKGIFYTGSEVAHDLVNDLDFSKGQTIFDPSCGSGVLLLSSDAPAEQIYGVDADPIAVMIAKFNYFLKYPNAKRPNIFHDDFFEWHSTSKGVQFTYVIGNPPYGATLDIAQIPTQYVTSGESFSYFIEFCYSHLTPDGLLRFLVPEAILNVKRHTDIRDFILDHTNLARIKWYSKKFSGVMSDIFMIELDRHHTDTMIFSNGTTTTIPKNIFKDFKNHIFVHLNEQDIAIIKKVDTLKKYNLANSVFGLGVVTGDNKAKLLEAQNDDAEPIYTGKEVEKYTLLPPKKYLVYDRNQLQQVAPDAIYRAPQKLVYKTINKFLKVAIDTTGSLTSNSANIIIPTHDTLNIYTVLALLNSNLYSYLHLKLFGGVNKIAKENLIALPLPAIHPTVEKTIKTLVDIAMKTGNDEELQKFINEKIFHLTAEEKEYITQYLAPSKNK